MGLINSINAPALPSTISNVQAHLSRTTPNLPAQYRVSAPCTVHCLPKDIMRLIISILSPEEEVPLRQIKFFREFTGAKNDQPRRSKAVVDAVIAECWSLVNWLINHRGCTLTIAMSKTAAEKGHLRVLQWLREQGCPWNHVDTFASAVHGGHVPVLEWLLDKGCKADENICQLAAERGHLEVLQWAYGKGFTINEEDSIFDAARNGHIEVLEWLRTEIEDFDDVELLSRIFASNGKIEALEWAHAEDLPWDESVTSAAAEHGHLNTLQWLHRMGCPWDEETCERAAKANHLEILEWALAHDCPMNERTLIIVQENAPHLLHYIDLKG